MIKRKRNNKPVAYQNGIVSLEEDLPYPFVKYPGHYGSFVGFSKNKKSDIVFCSCCQQSISNWIEIVNKDNSKQHRFTYGIADFPQELQDEVLRKKIPFENIINMATFEDEICHKCLGIVPEYSYCHEMYGGKFKQAYGWYISAKAYEWGMYSILGTVLLEKYAPDEVLTIYRQEFEPDMKKLNEARPGSNEWFDAQSQMFKSSRKLTNLIENDVRIQTGYRRIGEGWVAETQLYYLVKKLFKECTVIHHYRGSELDGLELDVYVKEINLGIEYQGQQHFKPVRHWGGEEALKKTKLRDKRKEKICKTVGIQLEKFYYNEDISPKYLKSKLTKYLK